MARRTKYEFGKTYYSIFEVELTESEARVAEKHEDSASGLKGTEPRYADAIEYWESHLPLDLSPRERSILAIAKKIGYIEAMAERTLWFQFEQESNLELATKSRKIGTEKRNKAIERKFREKLSEKGLLEYLPGPFDDNADLQIRKDLAKEEGISLVRLNQILIELKLRIPVQKRRR